MSKGEVKDFIRRMLVDWRTGYLPERDNLAAETEGDNLRHVIVRGAFLDRFAQDLRVEAIINEWHKRIGLH